MTSVKSVSLPESVSMEIDRLQWSPSEIFMLGYYFKKRHPEVENMSFYLDEVEEKIKRISDRLDSALKANEDKENGGN